MSGSARPIDGKIKKETLLVIEDDNSVATLERKYLERSGYSIITVETSEEARNQIIRGNIDLIILDYKLPNGITGLEFYDKLKSDGFDIPVIMVTGFNDEETIIRALRAGVRDFITKSLKYLDYLPEAVERILAQERTAKAFAASQAELKHSTSLLLATVEATADGLVVINRCGVITNYNQRFVEVLGVPHEVLASKDHVKVVEFIRDQIKDTNKFVTKVKDLYAQPQVQSFDVLEFKDGRVIEHVSRPQMLDGHPVGRVISFRDITERIKSEERLSYLAHRDALTSLPNRTLLQDRLNQAMVQAQRDHRLVALMFLDLDRFKGINDTLGHAIGDLLLKAVAERLTKCVREGDTVARFGGDEFTVVLTNLTRSHDVARVAQKIIEAISQPFVLLGPELFVTASMGITLYPSDEDSIAGLLKNADSAMYRAKESGRNNYQFYTDEMNLASFDRLKLESGLRHALKRNELMIYYQPQVDLKTGQIDGAEALLRWNHPELGSVSPSRFIPIAEETGLIIPIGEWVLSNACAQNKAWQEAGYPPIRMTVNISSRQFMQNYLIETVARILRETRLDPYFLDLELTESVIMQNAEVTITLLKNLNEMRVKFSIDDFGVGYSSLSYLKRFPIHILKIDPSFIRDVTTVPADAAIAISIMTLAHSLKLTVIAEGVETKDQLFFLRDHGCDGMQGYLFSPALPAEDFVRLLREKKHLEL